MPYVTDVVTGGAVAAYRSVLCMPYVTDVVTGGAVDAYRSVLCMPYVTDVVTGGAYANLFVLFVSVTSSQPECQCNH